MWLASFLSCLKSDSPRTRRDRGRRLKRHRRLDFTPRLEALEDRTVPSTFLVENLADSGPGSLRQAVLDANAQPGADQIFFTGQAHGTITPGGQLDVTDDLEIRGPGAELVAVSGNDVSRVFEISRGVTAFLAGLTITHGQAEDGGGIYNAGALTVDHCTLSANQAVGGEGGHARGGGIFNAAGAVLTVTRSVLSNNQAVGGDGGPGVTGGEGAGGGIYNLDATLTVSHSTFTGNQAVGGNNSAGAGGGIGNGGALASEGIAGLAFLSVSHSTLSANQAIGGTGGVFVAEDSDGHGGAIFNRGWTTVLVRHSTVSRTQATGGARPPRSGRRQRQRRRPAALQHRGRPHLDPHRLLYLYRQPGHGRRRRLRRQRRPRPGRRDPDQYPADRQWPPRQLLRRPQHVQRQPGHGRRRRGRRERRPRPGRRLPNHWRELDDHLQPQHLLGEPGHGRRRRGGRQRRRRPGRWLHLQSFHRVPRLRGHYRQPGHGRHRRRRRAGRPGYRWRDLHQQRPGECPAHEYQRQPRLDQRRRRVRVVRLGGRWRKSGNLKNSGRRVLSTKQAPAGPAPPRRSACAPADRHPFCRPPRKEGPPCLRGSCAAPRAEGADRPRA